MKKEMSVFFVLVIILFVFLSLSTNVLGVDVEANYDVVDSTTKVSYKLYSNDIVKDYFIPIPYDAKNLDIVTIEDNWNYDTIIADDDSRYILFDEFRGRVEIYFDSEIFIDEGTDVYFVADFKEFEYENLNIFVNLPDDAKLKYKKEDARPSFIPTTGKLSTDGQRMMLSWSDSDFINNSAILIIYKLPNTFDFNLGIIALLIAIIILSYIIFKKTKVLEKNFDKATANLYEDEKLIVEALFATDDKSMWQKELANKTNLTKVRLSRKLRNLESKGVIEKVPYGNTNKIKLKEN